jgi:hypothetical protein
MNGSVVHVILGNVSDEFNGGTIPSNRGPPPGGPPGMGADFATYLELNTFKKYAVPVIISFGVLANILICYVFVKTKMKQISTSRYFAAIAVTDTGFLLTTLVIHLKQFQVPIYTTHGPCQLTIFGNHVFTFLSIWYLTALVVDKHIGVYWPMKKNKMCTVFRAKCVIIALAVLAVVCYLYITWFFGAVEIHGTPQCSIWSDQATKESWEILTRMDAAVAFVIPHIIVFILGILIACRTCQYYRMSRPAAEKLRLRNRLPTTLEKEYKTTPVLLAIIATTMILCLPNSVYRLYILQIHEQPPIAVAINSGIFHLLYSLNYSIKILIYLAWSDSFRKHLFQLFRCPSHKSTHTHTNTNDGDCRINMHNIVDGQADAVVCSEGAV